MYAIDAEDRVEELKGFPQCDTGAPSPMILSTEGACILLYRIASEVDVLEEVARVHFTHCFAAMHGPPNDEALNGHPLYERGLRFYGAYEVLKSSWIRGLERANRVHPLHSLERYARLRHFVFTFHDSTFECVAENYSVEFQASTIDLAAITIRTRGLA